MNLSPQASIVNLTGYKSNLFNINLGVHNLMAQVHSLTSSMALSFPNDLRIHGIEPNALHNNTAGSLDNQQMVEAAEGQGQCEVKLRGFEALQESVVSLYAKWDDAFHL